MKSLNTGLVEGGTGWYSVVLGQNRAVLVASMTSFQKIYGLHGLDHQIIEYSKKKIVITDRQTNRQTDRISSCRLDPFCRRGRVNSAKLATEYLCLYFKTRKVQHSPRRVPEYLSVQHSPPSHHSNSPPPTFFNLF